MGERELLLFAIASAIVTANAYYIHPIISLVADHFGVREDKIGMVPSFNQLALALGIFLMLPLGDRFSNRKLTLIFVSGQLVALTIMAFAQQFMLFLIGSTLLGFFTIAPYILPAYVSKRIPNSRLGHANATLTAGIIFGILVARVGAGWIGEHLNWRMVYYFAAGVMVIVSVFLFFLMEERQKRPETAEKPPGYFALIFSIFPIIRKYPEILIAGSMQGLGFGSFLALWMGIGLHLPSPEMGYGTDVPGYLAGLTIFNLAITPRLGRWADRTGARKARVIMACIQLFGVALLSVTGHSLWLLIIPLMISNTVGPVIDVTNRMTFLSEAPEVRTRLMTVYIVLMFVGGGIASWAGTAAFHFGGWLGTSLLCFCLTACVCALSIVSYLWKGRTQR